MIAVGSSCPLVSPARAALQRIASAMHEGLRRARACAHWIGRPSRAMTKSVVDTIGWALVLPGGHKESEFGRKAL